MDDPHIKRHAGRALADADLAAAQANVGSEPPTGFDSASSLAPQSYSRLACYRATNMLWQK